jgi:hypothetical protein
MLFPFPLYFRKKIFFILGGGDIYKLGLDYFYQWFDFYGAPNGLFVFVHSMDKTLHLYCLTGLVYHMYCVPKYSYYEYTPHICTVY